MIPISVKKRETMSRKEYCLIGLVVVLVGIYAVFFTDWFRTRPIRIEHTLRSPREAWTGTGTRLDTNSRPAQGVTFSLHKDYRLTSVSVVSLAEFLTNQFAHPLWHIVADKESAPVNSIAYGRTLPGMKPAVEGDVADPLLANVEYRLLIETRKQKGEHDFKIEAARAVRR